jgi:hypothetical protein
MDIYLKKQRKRVKGTLKKIVGPLPLNKTNERTEKRKNSQITLKIVTVGHFMLAEGQLISIYIQNFTKYA